MHTVRFNCAIAMEWKWAIFINYPLMGRMSIIMSSYHFNYVRQWMPSSPVHFHRKSQREETLNCGLLCGLSMGGFIAADLNSSLDRESAREREQKKPHCPFEPFAPCIFQRTCPKMIVQPLWKIRSCQSIKNSITCQITKWYLASQR